MKKLIFLSAINFILFIIPINVLAHGTETHENEEVVNYWNYGFIASLLVLVTFLGLVIWMKRKMNNLDVKNKENRKKHHAVSKRRATYKWISVLVSVSTLFFLMMININGGEKEVTFKHIHGLGYTSDGKELFVPAHDGLRVYKDGLWTVPEEGKKHDYMGFSMVKEGFYSSGHPAPNSDLANPLGIVKTKDLGKTLEKLDLYGEVDFHGMTVGYETQEIYVFNPSENSRMDQPGFYYSSDDTKTWNKSLLQGLEGQATSLAAHPTKEGVVAIGTNQGAFLSDDHGNHFEKLPRLVKISAISFDHQNNLLVATQADGVKLFRIELPDREVSELDIPTLDGDSIAYVKQNPENKDELVFATNTKDIYFSHDGGDTWNQSVDKGIAKQQHKNN
ncbi:hypothetical protein SAMN05421743_11475 [Thalassobacillus cyri]|uniref:Glycosyl hydrolase n=1 Tax=Thalassobacillus cyri TaxID=571932 RepID=A0A1H4G7J8_9BACI|nr:hypothetical protein [Thalassobacillus cyri]SEB05606.1 hypothetical protein SAMN05421743_11475 [Thalassobacillus cyri]